METEGIILRTHDYAESDRLVTFFSPHIGRATAIAKGAKRSKKRFVNKLEPFTHLKISCRPPRSGSLYFLGSAELENAFLSLRQNYHRYTIATFISELVLRFTRDNDRETRLFDLLHWAHRSQDAGRSPTATLAVFMIKLLQYSGYQPELSRCSHCQTPITPKLRYSFLPESGLRCSACRHDAVSLNHFPITVRTIRLLHSTQRLSISRLDRLHLPENSSMEAILALSRYCRNILQQDIHSLEQIRMAGKFFNINDRERGRELAKNKPDETFF
ncbi:MAG: DNA repair protein RecO [Desulfobulbaceae bacterium]|nr:DNA repair protein RecO [Desulfobulbaceae bacterium]